MANRYGIKRQVNAIDDITIEFSKRVGEIRSFVHRWACALDAGERVYLDGHMVWDFTLGRNAEYLQFFCVPKDSKKIDINRVLSTIDLKDCHWEEAIQVPYNQLSWRVKFEPKKDIIIDVMDGLLAQSIEELQAKLEEMHKEDEEKRLSKKQFSELFTSKIMPNLKKDDYVLDNESLLYTPKENLSYDEFLDVFNYIDYLVQNSGVSIIDKNDVELCPVTFCRNLNKDNEENYTFVYESAYGQGRHCALVDYEYFKETMRRGVEFAKGITIVGD